MENDEVKVMVVTAAFGIGIDKANIRHVIRYGVPEFDNLGSRARKSWQGQTSSYRHYLLFYEQH